MPPRKKEEPIEEGRFFEIRDQVAGQRRGAYKLTNDIAFPEMTRTLLKQWHAAETQEEKIKILLGNKIEEVEELYADRPIEEWVAFLKDVRAHYFGQGAEEIPGGSNGS